MSTKSTLWSNDDFHLYKEAFDDSNVHLEIETPFLEQMTLRIPLEVWKEMRQHTIQPTECYLNLTDVQLIKEAESAVDAHRGGSRMKLVAPQKRSKERSCLGRRSQLERR